MDKQIIDQVWAAFQEVAEEKKAKMDAVDKDELKGDHADRDDKDIDNDGDVDSSDKYLHKRRKVIKKAISKKDDSETDTDKEIEEAQSPAQKAAFEKMLAKGKKGKGKDGDKDEEEDEKLDEAQSPAQKAAFEKMLAKGKKGKDKDEDGDDEEKEAKDVKEVTAVKNKPAGPKMNSARQRAFAKLDSEPKKKVSLAPAPFDIPKKDPKMPIQKKPALKASYKSEHVERVLAVLEGNKQPNATGGKPESMEDKLTPSDKKMVKDHGGLGGADSGIDGAKAAEDTAKAIKSSQPSKTTEKPTAMRESTILADFFQALRDGNK